MNSSSISCQALPLLGALDRVVKRRPGPLRNSFFASYPVAAMLLMRGSTGGVYFMVFNCLITMAIVVGFHLGTNYGSAVTGGGISRRRSL